jgi:hypothetical protein
VDFSRLGKGIWVLDDGAGRRKGALAVYTPLGRACTAECCVCNIHAPLRNSTWASGVQTGYSEPQRALWTMSNRQVLPLVNKQHILLILLLYPWPCCTWERETTKHTYWGESQAPYYSSTILHTCALRRKCMIYPQCGMPIKSLFFSKNRKLSCTFCNHLVTAQGMRILIIEIKNTKLNGLTRSVHHLLVAANVNILFSWTRFFKVRTLVHCNQWQRVAISCS